MAEMSEGQAIVRANGDIEQGLYISDADLPASSPRLHQSIATVLVNRSPLHAWHRHFHPEPEEYDAVTMRGLIAHSLLLGGGRIYPIEADDWRTKAAKEARNAALRDGKLPILAHKLADAVELHKRVLLELKARGIVLSGWNEVIVKWESPGGVLCEGRIDHLIIESGSALILDFKFCASAVKKACENRFIEFGYDIQHAAYVQAVETNYPHLAGRVEMKFIFVEVDPPHAIREMPVAGSMRTSGQWRWGKACEVWQGCLEKYGTKTPWPAYADDGEPAECPTWALNQQIMEAESA